MNSPFNFKMPPTMGANTPASMQSGMNPAAPAPAMGVPASQNPAPGQITDPYMLELLKNYYAQAMASQPTGTPDYGLTDSALGPMGAPPSLSNLMRYYKPSVTQRPTMPAMPASLQFPAQSQSNAFFTL